MKIIKKMLILSLSANSLLVPLALVSCNNNQNTSETYQISFGPTNSFTFGESSSLASTKDSNWIKAKIVEQQNSIFKFTGNLPDNFNLLSNLSIVSINTNDQQGTMSFVVKLNNANQDGDTIQQQITFTGFLKTTIASYSIVFSSDTSFAFGDSSKLVSSIDVTWIKNQVITKKNEIFQINGQLPDTFNWNNNLQISLLNKDTASGLISFEATLLNSSSDNNTISKTLTFTGFKVEGQPSNDNILLPDDPNSIPNDLPSKPEITEEEKRWGNVLLPKVPDNQITEDLLIKMLDDHIGNTNYVEVTFGERKISSKLMADAFAKWITTRWKYFPYLTFSNPVFKINIKDENGTKISWKTINNWNQPEFIEKTYYVDSLSTYKGPVFDYYAERWLIQGFYKNQFIEFINDFLNLISYDMDDIDKVMTAYFYVANSLRYKDSQSIEATIVNRQGVCADYASLMALLCNIVGVPTLPMVTSHHQIDYNAMHEIVWVYINDLYDGSTKKWYALDPTFAYGQGGSYSKPISFWPTNLNIENVLFNFDSDSYKNYPTDPHYNSNLFFNAPWKTLYNNKTVETRDIPDNFVSQKYTHKSNPVYYDGYWYYYCWDEKDTSSSKYKNKLVRSKFVTADTYEVVIDFSNPSNPDINNFGFKISSEICNLFKDFNQYSFRYHSFGYNEKIVLCTNIKKTDFDNSVRFLIIDLKTKQLKLINQTVDIRSASLKDFNFYIKDGDIYYTSDPYGNGQTSWYTKIYSKLNLTDEEHDFLNSSSDNYSKLFRKISLYRTIVGTYLVGTNPVNNVSQESKYNFMQYLYDLEQKLNKNQINDFDAAIKDLDSKYNAFIPPITSQGVIKTNELCNVYQYEKSYVDSIDSLPLNKLILADSLLDFSTNDNNIAFDIYYSRTKNGIYKKVRNELYLESTGINVSLSDIGQSSYDGYYYFEYYPYGLYNQRQKSKVFEIQIVDTKTLPDFEGLSSQSNKNTNYYDNSTSWYNNKIALKFKLHNMLSIQSSINLELKYINFDSEKITILDKEILNKGSSSTIEEKWVIDKPNASNHGIYWVEYQMNLQGNIYKFYSNFYFHFMKSDVDNFNVEKWSNLSNQIN